MLSAGYRSSDKVTKTRFDDLGRTVPVWEYVYDVIVDALNNPMVALQRAQASLSILEAFFYADQLIRRLWTRSDQAKNRGVVTQDERAEQFGVSRSIVAEIDAGLSWAGPLNSKRRSSKARRVHKQHPLTPLDCQRLLAKLEKKVEKVRVKSDDPVFILADVHNQAVHEHWFWTGRKKVEMDTGVPNSAVVCLIHL